MLTAGISRSSESEYVPGKAMCRARSTTVMTVSPIRPRMAAMPITPAVAQIRRKVVSMKCMVYSVPLCRHGVARAAKRSFALVLDGGANLVENFRARQPFCIELRCSLPGGGLEGSRVLGDDLGRYGVELDAKLLAVSTAFIFGSLRKFVGFLREEIDIIEKNLLYVLRQA